MRRALLPIVAFTVVGLNCGREIPLESQPPTAVNGYRIEGTMSDGLGRPLMDLPVRLFYDPAFSNTDSIPDPGYAGTNEFVRVSVYDSDANPVRQLFSGVVQETTIVITWDHLDDGGNAVGSGLYNVEFVVGSQIRKSYDVIVDGNVTAYTDSLGHYVIREKNLPVGATVPYYNGGNFLGWYRLDPSVYLEFDTQSGPRTYHVGLDKDVVTEFSAVIQ